MNKFKDIDQFISNFNSMTYNELEELYSVSSVTINRWRKELGLYKRKNLPEQLTEKQYQLIVGGMLGDGSLSFTAKNPYIVNADCV